MSLPQSDFLLFIITIISYKQDDQGKSNFVAAHILEDIVLPCIIIYYANKSGLHFVLELQVPRHHAECGRTKIWQMRKKMAVRRYIHSSAVLHLKTTLFG